MYRGLDAARLARIGRANETGSTVRVTRKRATLKDLINAGLLKPGEELTCEPRQGEVYIAQLMSDGTILYNGSAYATPSAWADHVAGNARNGWEDVSAQGRPVKEFRSQLQSTQGSPKKRVQTDSSADATKRGQAGHSPVPDIPDSISEEEHIEQDLLERVRRLSPNDFESQVVEFLRAMDFSNVRGTGRSGDDGIDGEFEMPFLKVKGAFQASGTGKATW